MLSGTVKRLWQFVEVLQVSWTYTSHKFPKRIENQDVLKVGQEVIKFLINAADRTYITFLENS